MSADSFKGFSIASITWLVSSVFFLAGVVSGAWAGVGNHTLYIDGNGALWAIGDNDNGQLSDGNQIDLNLSTQVLLSGVVAVAEGGAHSLYLKDDGSLWAAGDNTYGQLGDGTNTDRNSSFVQVVDANVTAVTAGQHHSLFLKSDGSLWAMGRNDYGQLGTGDGTQKIAPTLVFPSGVATISAGAYHSLLIKHDGSLWGMGRNDSGQLGNGFTANLDGPQQILSSGLAGLAAGEGHSLFLKTDGSLWATGLNMNGQLGLGDDANRSLPVKVVEANVTIVAAGGRHTLFLDANGSLWAAGANESGQLGDQTTADRNSSVSVVSADVAAVAAGAGHSYFLKTDGSLWAMGLNADGQLGLGNVVNVSSPVQVVSAGPYRLPGQQAVVGQGSFFSLIRDVNGSLRGMGQNDNGELGLTGSADRTSSMILSSSAKAFSVGGDYSLFAKSDGSLWGMGSNAYGQLGDGTMIDRNESVQIWPSGVAAASASGSGRFSLFLESNGSLLGMGRNLNGELGLGDTDQRLTPVSLATSVVSFASGHDHALYVKRDGSLWAMGSNTYGQLGDGTMADRNASVQVDANVSAVAAGDGHSFFLKRDGSLWSMGRNDFGQLGDGTRIHRSSPVKVFETDVTAIATGDHHSLFLKSDGSLWGMGRNHCGQLGMNDYSDRGSPTKIITMNVTDVFAGQAHTLILKTNALYGTGLNQDGQLGLGDLINRNSFYFVPSSSVTALPGVPTQGGTSPVILSYEGNATALVSAEENSTSLSVANLLVYDLETSPLSYSIVGGADADLFELNTSSVTQVTLESGKEVNATSTVVDFKLYPDYENPHDADLNNVYEVIVRVTDGNLTDDQALEISVVDANDTSLAFTNAGVAGRLGPTQAQLDANYTDGGLQGNILVGTQGIQEWTVPYKALYRIEAFGARGGSVQGSFPGGLGARAVGVFDLNVSSTLSILVGHEGNSTTVATGAGGGGGSFVVLDDKTSLLVAGGGGGAGLGETGGDGNASILSNSSNANGGGSLDENASSSAGGVAFLYGGSGGEGSGFPEGGFGGGGAASSSNGGGGGGSKGGDGGSGGNSGGQGGGSFNADPNGLTATGYHDGNGSVLITLIKSLNALPSDIDLNASVVWEDSPKDTIVGEFNATDADANATLVFTLVDGNGSTHNGFFTLESNGTLLTSNTALDYEINATMKILVRVTDNHNAIYEKAFVVSVLDVDDTPPIITLSGDANVTHEAGTRYVDANATWFDSVDGNGTVIASVEVNASAPGAYTLVYSQTDAAGNVALDRNRTVTVVDTISPVIAILGEANMTHEAGTPYVDANATWTDLLDGNGTVVATGEVNSNELGTYTLVYSRVDVADNIAVDRNRTVTVVDTTPPVIMILGDVNETHEAGIPWVDDNATWTDNVDGNGTASWEGGTNPYLLGVYYITYRHADSSGNEAELVTRTITVVDTMAPVIALEGNASVFHEAGQVYQDSGAIWIDVLDGNGTADVNGSVLPNIPGTYILTYSKTDAAGNEAVQVSRTITVRDTANPIIVLDGNATLRHRVFQPYLDAGSIATDSLDGNLSATLLGTVDINIPGIYTLSYSVRDVAGNEAVTMFREIEVFNEAPTGITPKVLEVEEVLPVGSLVGTLSTIDPDDPNATREYSYSLAAETESVDNGSFVLEANGTLRTSLILDFETKPSYTILVRVTDEFNASLEEILTVEVVDAFPPAVNTVRLHTLVASAAFIEGNVTDEGHGLGVSEHGFVLGFVPDLSFGVQGATTASVGSGAGEFNSTLAEVLPATRYYFRAYATNAEGTGYGALEWFDTNESENIPSWSNAEEISDVPGWWQSPWFGSFTLTVGTDWIFHEQFGWLYVATDGTDGVWFWQRNLGWLWSSGNLYPHIYLQTSGWHYFLGGSDERFFLFRYSDESWLDISQDK